MIQRKGPTQRKRIEQLRLRRIQQRKRKRKEHMGDATTRKRIWKDKRKEQRR